MQATVLLSRLSRRLPSLDVPIFQQSWQRGEAKADLRDKKSGCNPEEIAPVRRFQDVGEDPCDECEQKRSGPEVWVPWKAGACSWNKYEQDRSND